MILKHADDKSMQISELERLLARSSSEKKKQIELELRMFHAGIKGEKESAYFIDFDLKDSKNTMVIHDLRLECNGRVAQIDHLLIHKTMAFFVLETKHYHAGLKIGEDGQFLKWNDYKKTFEGMASPLAQNERHITVLKDVVEQLEWPTRLGVKLTPTYEPFVLVSSNARIDRPKKFDSSRVVKSDGLINAIDRVLESRGVLETFGALAKIVSTETLEGLGRALVSQHCPAKVDYMARFGEPVPVCVVAPSPAKEGCNTEAKCRFCTSGNLSVQYGKYGYYFKCTACDGNTPIKLECGKTGHKERLRKDGNRFFRECSECGSSHLYFVNC